MFLKSIMTAAVLSSPPLPEMPSFAACGSAQKFTSIIKKYALQTWRLGRLENGQIIHIVLNPATHQFIVFWHLKNGKMCAAPGNGFRSAPRGLNV